MKKVIFETDIPEISLVETPIEYKTELGIFYDLKKAEDVKQVIEIIKEHKDLKYILNADRDLRKAFALCILKRYTYSFWGVDEYDDYSHRIAEYLSPFSDRCGYPIDQIGLTIEVNKQGYKYQLEGNKALYNDMDEVFYFLANKLMNDMRAKNKDVYSIKIEEKQ